MHTKFWLGSLKKRSKSKWEDNIKINLEETGWGEYGLNSYGSG
jgi:hypothetical protein